MDHPIKERSIWKIANKGIGILNHPIKPQLKYSRLLLVAVLALSSAMFFLTRPDFSFGKDISNLRGEAFVKEFIHVFHRGDINEIFSYMGAGETQMPEGAGEELGQMMENMGQMLSQAMGGMFKQMLASLVPHFNQGKISTITLLSRQRQGAGPGATEKYIHHVLFDTQKAATVHTDIINLEKGSRVLNFNYFLLAPANINDLEGFVLEGKSVEQYVFLSIAVISTLFCLTMLVLCVKSEISKKWLWFPLILLGVGQLTIPWVSGNYPFKEIFHVLLLHIQILPIGFLKADFEPWVLSITLPLGAILFLFKYISDR